MYAQSCFANSMYATYLQKRFGINSCKKKGNINLLLNDLHISTDILKLCNISSCSTGSTIQTPSLDPTSGLLYVSVRAGTAAAIAKGIIVGNTTFYSSLLINHNVIIFKGSYPLPDQDPGNGGQYFTKEFIADTVVFSDPIQPGELIQIFTV
jgi:hypothetical protein